MAAELLRRGLWFILNINYFLLKMLVQVQWFQCYERCSKLIIKRQFCTWCFGVLAALSPLWSLFLPHGEQFLFLLPGPSVTLGCAEIRCQSSGQISGLSCSNISLPAQVPPCFGDLFFQFFSLLQLRPKAGNSFKGEHRKISSTARRKHECFYLRFFHFSFKTPLM